MSYTLIAIHPHKRGLEWGSGKSDAQTSQPWVPLQTRKLLLQVFTSWTQYVSSVFFKEEKSRGLPWWHSGWESACQCRGHGFEPFSGKIPHAAEQLGPWATTAEPAHLEPVLRNKRGRDSERPAHHDEEWPPLAATREKPSHRNEDPTQPKINK